jgi:hypothetical protein
MAGGLTGATSAPSARKSTLLSRADPNVTE